MELLTIGEFSKLTGLTIKALRFYHENRVLEPQSVDRDTGYRYYAVDQVDAARAIRVLRELNFPVVEIGEIIGNRGNGEGLVALLEQRRVALSQAMREDQERLRRLDEILAIERLGECQAETSDFQVEEQQIAPQLIASIKHQGSYADCAKLFPKIARRFGRFLVGKPLMLCWDSEYREHDGNFEVAFPVRKGENKPGIEVYELTGGRAVTLTHRGAYEEIHRSYRKLLSYLSRHRLKYKSPTREVYHKGPGMLFRGKPEKYLTELQVLLAEEPDQGESA